MTAPMSMVERLFLVFVALYALTCARRTRFDADRWLFAVVAWIFLSIAVADVILWWPL